MLVIYHFCEVRLFGNIEILLGKQLHLLVPILCLNNVGVNMHQLCYSVPHRLIAALKPLKVKECYIIHLLVSLVHAFKKISTASVRRRRNLLDLQTLPSHFN